MDKKTQVYLAIACISAFMTLTPLSAIAAESGTQYINEAFTDANLAARGWYDGTAGHRVVYDAERAGNVLELNFPTTGGQTGLGALRHAISESDTVHVRYYVKYSTNWEWTGQSYGPHEFLIMTNKQSSYAGPAYTNLTCYIEVNNGKPHLIIQDSMNIDSARINQDLTQVTENRAVAGGNGCNPDGYEYCSAYNSGGNWNNNKGWKTPTSQIQNGKWYLVEAEFKMNSIVNGKAVADGHVKYWLNNSLLINHENVILRTGQNPNMLFNQVMIAPYYHNGVPHPQTFWVDDFVVSNAFIGGVIQGLDTTPPAQPTGVKVTPVQ